MKVPAGHVCEHGYTQPWATCIDCMYKPQAERPVPPAPPPPPRVARRGELPKGPDDPKPALLGDKDVSYAVYEVDPHVEGPGNDWLFAESNGFPWDLRAGGWVYLRCRGRLRARARVRGIGFRPERRWHTGADKDDRGPGPTIELDPDTWEWVDIDLGTRADSQHQGYRYLITAVDGTVTHLTRGEAIPPHLIVDPPAPRARTVR